MKQYVHWTAKEEPCVLNLDPAFTPTPTYRELAYKPLLFLGGESHITISPVPHPGELLITHRINNAADIIMVLLANDAARRMGFKNIKLLIPYFPAARQDRVCNEGEPLTVKVFADLINGCKFDEVIILCPHSEVAPALLNNVTVLNEYKYVRQAVSETSNGHHYNIVCPDAGAGKRVGSIIKHLSDNNGYITFNLIRCEKVRDVKTGKLLEFFVQADDLHGYPTMICDDINSMGGTFIGLGTKLREKNCGTLSLFTSHSDCVEGVQRVIEFFDKVFTTNSKKDWDSFTYTLDGKLTVFPVTLDENVFSSL